MKNILLLFLFAGIAFGTATAQCTPDPQFTGPGIYPLPSAGVLLATENVAYSQVLTVNVPADTTIDLSPLIGFPVPAVMVTVNFQEITGVTGLPLGLTTACDVNPCNWMGGTSGCLEISGAPTQTGQFTFNVSGSLNVNIPATVPVIGGTAQSIPFPAAYQMTVDPTVSIDPALANGLTVSQNSPNPFGFRTQVEVFSPFAADLSLEVFTLQGQVVQQQIFPQVAGAFTFDLDASALGQGIYFYRLSNGEQNVVRKMMVNR